MTYRQLHSVRVIMYAMVLLVGACSPFGAGTKQPTKNYVLNSLYSEEIRPQPLADLNDIGIEVGPVKMAMYLDRSDVVIRNTQNEIEVAEFATWAGPLQENFSRILAENLSLWLNTKKVSIFPGRKLQSPDYSVSVNVTRFDGRPGDRAHLRARWVVFGENRKKLLFQEHTVLSQPTANESIEAMVASQSQTVVDFSREIAEVINKLAKEKSTSQ